MGDYNRLDEYDWLLVAFGDVLSSEVVECEIHSSFMSVKLLWPCCGCAAGTELFWCMVRDGGIGVWVYYRVLDDGAIENVGVRAMGQFEVVRFDDFIEFLSGFGYGVYDIGGI